MECYLNCGCYPRRCKLGLPPASSAPRVEAGVRENLHFELRGWTQVSVSTTATEPLVVLTEAFGEPIVLLQPDFPARVPLENCMLMTYDQWVWSGYPNFARSIEYPKLKSLGTDGLKKLARVDSWCTSGVPKVMYGVYTREGELGRPVPNRETIDIWMRIGLRGFGSVAGSPKFLSWWKMYYRRLKSPSRASIVSRLWGLPWAWISSRRLFERGPNLSRSPWTVTQQVKLLVAAPDTLFSQTVN